VSRKPGRPPRASKPSLERVEIRVTKAEKAAWERAARLAPFQATLSEWIRECLNDAASSA
jgi:hypothetical protein